MNHTTQKQYILRAVMEANTAVNDLYDSTLDEPTKDITEQLFQLLDQAEALAAKLVELP